MLRTTGQGVTAKTRVGQQVTGEGHSQGTLGVSNLVLIGVGGIIGAGFFLGAGLPIRTAGPAVLLAYFLGALVMAQVTGALATLAVNDPEPGAFMTYANKYIGSFAGFLQGWTYYIASILTIASESVAMSVFTHLWIPFFPAWVLTSIYAAIVLLINAFGVRNFGRIEALMSVVKIAALIGFIVFLAIMIVQPAHHSHQVWSLTPKRLFPTGIGGLFQSMLIVIFAYAGVGVFATAATQMRRPKDIYKAALVTVVALAVLYLISIGLLLAATPWNETSTATSPFVTALEMTGVPLLGGVFNFIILVASFSVMAGSVFSANEILQGLGNHRQAPNFVLRMNRMGTSTGSLSITAIGVALTILISYLLPANVYSFLISASSFLTFLNWFLILWAFLSWRKRNALSRNKTSSLAFGQPVSSVITLLFIVFLTGYSLLQPDQRLGFYAFVALCVVVSLGFFATHGRTRSAMHRE